MKKVDASNLKHIAFIMDGNRRWAKAKGMPSKFGHSAGYKSMLSCVTRCVELGIPYVSFFAWSTENWNRSDEEVGNVFDIVREKSSLDIDKLTQGGIKLVTMGDISRFPKDLQEKLADAVEKTKNNNKCTLNLCVNYGGRADIVQAVNKAVKQQGKITEENFGELLYGAELPDIDLCVRTSGEQRISNFMLWKLAYAEFYFAKKFWPAADGKFVDECVTEFNKRLRRFGGK